VGDIQHEKVLRMATAKPFPLLVIAVVEDNPADVYCITRVLHARMVVQLDNGPQVLVPTHLFIPQPDGSYALPCRLAALEPARSGHEAHQHEPLVVPVLGHGRRRGYTRRGHMPCPRGGGRRARTSTASCLPVHERRCEKSG
jgi:hypothetical protein